MPLDYLPEYYSVAEPPVQCGEIRLSVSAKCWDSLTLGAYFKLKFKRTTSWTETGEGSALEIDLGISQQAFLLSLLTQL